MYPSSLIFMIGLKFFFLKFILRFIIIAQTQLAHTLQKYVIIVFFFYQFLIYINITKGYLLPVPIIEDRFQGFYQHIHVRIMFSNENFCIFNYLLRYGFLIFCFLFCGLLFCDLLIVFHLVKILIIILIVVYDLIEIYSHALKHVPGCFKVISDWVLNHWCKSVDTWIVTSSYCVVVIVAMITQMDGWHHVCWLDEYLRQRWEVNLMNHGIELKDRGHGVDFELVAPCAVLGHVTTVLLNRLIVLDEMSVQLFILKDMLYSSFSIYLIPILITLELISNCPEQAIAITFHFLNFQAKWRKLLPKLLHIQQILLLVFLSLQILSLPFIQFLCFIIRLFLFILHLFLLLFFLLIIFFLQNLFIFLLPMLGIDFFRVFSWHCYVKSINYNSFSN